MESAAKIRRLVLRDGHSIQSVGAAFLAGGKDLELVFKAGIVPPVSGIGQNALEGATGERLDLWQHRFERVCIMMAQGFIVQRYV